MALPAACGWEVRTTGSDTACSGGFVAGASGTDYSQQNAAQYNGTDLVVDNSVATKVTSATHSFVAADVGNVLRVTSGAGWTAGFYQIVSTAAGAATLDRTPAGVAIVGGAYCVGGAFATPGQAGAAHAAGNKIYLRSGSYTVNNAAANVAGGCVSLLAGTAAAATQLTGYGTARGDEGTRPVLTASGITAFTLVNLNGSARAAGIEVSGASLTTSRGFVLASGAMTYRCKASLCSANGFGGTGNAAGCVACEAYGCTAGYGFSTCSVTDCVSRNHTGASGFNVTGFGVTAVGSLAFGNTGSGFLGPQNGYAARCTAYGNTADGFQPNAGTNHTVNEGCVAWGNGWNYNAGSAFDGGIFLNCAGGGGVTGNYRTALLTGPVPGFVTLTANPFDTAAIAALTATSTLAEVFAAFRPNNAAGGGALVRAAGFVAYADIGAVQHQDAGGAAANYAFWG